jgi:peptidoglycan/xylan/chitin deacetylase (PgdA/CDA1 family)
MSGKNGNSVRNGILVLLYHAVTAETAKSIGWRERKYWMGRDEFHSHVALLATGRFPVLPLARAWQARTDHVGTSSTLWPGQSPAPVVLTFDDGHRSAVEIVWPALREAGMAATFFVNTATLGKPGYLCWREVRAMSAGGALVASHGHRHVDMTALGRRALDVELRMSKDLLEGWTGQRVEFFAAPYGRVNRRVVDAALEAGYRAVCSSEPRPARRGGTSVSRIAIHAGTTTDELAGFLEGRRFPYWARRARSACLALPKRLLPVPHARPTAEPEAAR